jgi:hypothetical protein
MTASASTQFVPFRPIGVRNSLHITYKQVLAAMEKASRKRGVVATGTKYAVMNPETGETYSPKELLRLVVGSSYSFHGGRGVKGANRIFHTFGFPVGRHDKLLKKRQELIARKYRVVPTADLLKKLFTQRWKLLPSKSELWQISGGLFPGVYMLAYSDRRLDGAKVREEVVFYVGMTCEGGRSKRLQQFRQGITHGGFHSGGKRFYKVWLRRKPYDPKGKSRLYFAYVPVKCETAKEWRSPQDILILSKVPEVELAAIARVKARIHHEPLLNKK